MELDTPLSRSIIFGILLTLMIPSVVCSLFILYYFARSPELRKRLNNHVVLALLFISLIQVSHEQLMLKKILFIFSEGDHGNAVDVDCIAYRICGSTVKSVLSLLACIQLCTVC
jgi:hypothetical protein